MCIRDRDTSIARVALIGLQHNPGVAFQVFDLLSNCLLYTSSQFQNRDKAMRLLASRLYEIEREKQDADIARERKSQVGSGDRSEKIRTYNFPQGRVTDHRIGLTLYRIDAVLNGDLDELIDALVTADQAEKLKSGGETA